MTAPNVRWLVRGANATSLLWTTAQWWAWATVFGLSYGWRRWALALMFACTLRALWALAPRKLRAAAAKNAAIVTYEQMRPNDRQ